MVFPYLSLLRNLYASYTQRQLSKQWPFPSSAARAPLSWVSGRVLCHSFVAPCHGKAECWPSHEPPTGWGITLSVLPHPVCESASLGRDEIMFKGRFRRKRLLGSCGAEGASANDSLRSFRSATQRALCISSSRDLHANRCQFIMGSRLGTLSPRIYHSVCGGWPWEERPQVANCCIFSPKGENPFKGVIKDCGVTSFFFLTAFGIYDHSVCRKVSRSLPTWQGLPAGPPEFIISVGCDLPISSMGGHAFLSIYGYIHRFI